MIRIDQMLVLVQFDKALPAEEKKGIRTNDKWSSVFDLSIHLKFHVKLKLKLKQTALLGSSDKTEFFSFQ